MIVQRQAWACYHGPAMTVNRDVFLPTGWTASVLVHLALLSTLLIGSIRHQAVQVDPGPVVFERIRFYPESPLGPGGGGGGGHEGDRPTASTGFEPKGTHEPRRATLAPRKPRPLSFDDLNVPDLPHETALLLDGVFSPDGVDFPGLSLSDPRDWGGFDVAPSSGDGGGLGGGDGIGIGTGKDWGAGPGRNGGCCGGEGGGGWDTEPVPIYRPPNPAYPSGARERMISGEVILRVLVRVDGSTEVVGILKSLPHCLETALANAKLWRWKPARREGKPVEAFGIITVTFDIYTQA